VTLHLGGGQSEGWMSKRSSQKEVQDRTGVVQEGAIISHRVAHSVKETVMK